MYAICLVPRIVRYTILQLNLMWFGLFDLELINKTERVT